MAGSSGLVSPWWERVAVPCRDATPKAGSGCSEMVMTHTECETVHEGGEPVRKCVKLYKRYISCAGSPIQEEEQTQVVEQRGEGAPRLEPAELPARLGAGASTPAAAAPAPPPGASTHTCGQAPAGPACMDDVVHSMEEFLRWAEELQEEMVPGMVHLDQLPSAASRPYSEAEAQQERQAGGGQQWQQRQQGPAEPALPLAWLGGLLFGRRRGEVSSGAQPKPLDPATWREFEKDFTEV